MNKRKSWQWLHFVPWLLFALSCQTVGLPPDVPVCEPLNQRISTDKTNGYVIWSPSPTCMKQIDEPECGHCVYTVSGKEIFVGEKSGHHLLGKPWSRVKIESVIIPAESFADINAYITAWRAFGPEE